MNKDQIIILACCAIILICGSIYIKDRLRLNATTSDVGTDPNCTVITGIRLEEEIPKYKHLVIPDKDYLTSGTKTMQILTGSYATITQIGDSAFANNTYLETVYIPVSITHIRKNAFRNCTTIYEVNYEGSEEQWKQIQIEAGNDLFQSVTIHFNVKRPTTGD